MYRHISHFPMFRPQRLRYNKNIRDICSEVNFSIKNIIYPIFISKKTSIDNTLLGKHKFSLNELKKIIITINELGIPGVMIFGIPEEKDSSGSENLNKNSIVNMAIKIIKDLVPEMIIFTDLCLCDYVNTSDCAFSDKNGNIKTKETLEYLCNVAINYAESGSNFISPSGMIDGTVAAIRSILDKYNYEKTGILSYSTKFASNLYQPFREITGYNKSKVDRKKHQLNPANTREAINESIMDLEEGADMLLVKPASWYLDIIFQIKNISNIPIIAYQSSGEYGALISASNNNILNLSNTVIENLICIKRSGANSIITYFAMDIAKWIK